MRMISDHTFGGCRFREFTYDEATVSCVENWTGKRMIAVSPSLPSSRKVAMKLGIDLSKPYKSFSARGTDFYMQDVA